MILNRTGGGYTMIGVNGTDIIYGERYNDNVAVSNSVTFVLPALASFSVYYLDNAEVQVQGVSSRLTIALLTSGIQGPTGPSPWVVSGTDLSYLNGNVTIGVSKVQKLFAPTVVLKGNISNWSYTVDVTGAGWTEVIPDSNSNVLMTNGSAGMWLVTANATSAASGGGGVVLSACAYVAVNPAAATYVNLYGGFSSYSGLTSTAGTATGEFQGYGVFLYTTDTVTATYQVNFLRLS
jgi:hypothetical protein